MATLTIPDRLYERLQAAAANQRRPVDELLFEAIELVDPTTDAPEAKPMTREEEMQRLREALGDTLVTFDAHAFLTKLGIQPMTEDDLDRAMQELPVLGRSLSETIIQMRDEERN